MQIAVGVVGVEGRAFGGLGGSDGYGLGGAGRVGRIARGGRLPRRVLCLGYCLSDLLGRRGRGLLCGVRHGGHGLARGSDHAVLNAFDEFAHGLSS